MQVDHGDPLCPREWPRQRVAGTPEAAEGQGEWTLTQWRECEQAAPWGRSLAVLCGFHTIQPLLLFIPKTEA